MHLQYFIYLSGLAETFGIRVGLAFSSSWPEQVVLLSFKIAGRGSAADTTIFKEYVLAEVLGCKKVEV